MTAKTTVRTALVPREEILDLRWSVLRPGRPRAAAHFPEDDRPDTFHLAAYHGEDPEVLGCVTVFPEPPPGPSGPEGAATPGHATPGPAAPAHRFRGMATAPSVRGRGYGAALLRAAAEEAAARGAGLLWCNARSEARGFYERQGFHVLGEEFLVEDVGPHYVMARPLAADGGPPVGP